MRPLIRTAAAGIVLALLSACDTNGTTAPDEPDAEVAAAAAMIAADAALEDLGIMDASVPRAGAAPGAHAGAHEDHHGIGDREGLVRNRTVTFLDGAGGVQDGYDPVTTAVILTTLTVEGAIERDGFSASLVRTRELEVSGLEGAETTRTFDGTGTEAHERARVSDAFGSRTFRLSAEAEIDRVVVAVDRATSPWPLSGTITRHVIIVVARGTGEVVRERTVVITFDGTRYARLDVDGEVYEVDLAEEGRDRPLRRRHRGG